MLTDTRRSPYARVTPLAGKPAVWDDGLWRDCFETCAVSTVPQLKRMFDSADISHVVENFRVCAGDAQGNHRGTPFGDGDFYKWMEAAMYAAAFGGMEHLWEDLNYYIDLIARAQLPDGYLSTKQILGERQENGVTRLGDVNDFEVYNFGHLFTAACLHKRLTGREDFLKVAVLAAGYLETLYNKAAATGQVQTAVCPSHYMGLVELYRTTGDDRYRQLALLAIRLRDSVQDGTDDNQDRTPLREHQSIVGHAVRANYLYAGVADLCLETGDEELMSMLHRVWESLVQTKLYITGGCGALYNGVSPYGNFWKDQKIHQAYGYEYQLPNVTAYNETCAAIGGVMWAYRMFQMDPQAKYMDTLERMMLNTSMAAISLDGKRFFYENMLRRAKSLPYGLAWPLTRTEYITSYCCPPNLARMLSQSGEYAYLLSEDGIWAGLYGANHARVQLANGGEFVIRQETDYPYDGHIRFSFSEVTAQQPWWLYLRLPSWAKSGSLYLNGDEQPLPSNCFGTYLAVKISQTQGTVVELVLDMPVRLTTAHPLVEENTNQAAVERGPLVYCIEGVDVEEASMDGLMLPVNAAFETEEIQISDRRVLALHTEFLQPRQEKGQDGDGLYRTLDWRGFKKVKARLIPYFAWDNREVGEMKVWLPIAYT